MTCQPNNKKQHQAQDRDWMTQLCSCCSTYRQKIGCNTQLLWGFLMSAISPRTWRVRVWAALYANWIKFNELDISLPSLSSLLSCSESHYKAESKVETWWWWRGDALHQWTAGKVRELWQFSHNLTVKPEKPKTWRRVPARYV